MEDECAYLVEPPHVQKTRKLSSGDRSRYSQVRLTISRNTSASGTWSLILRTVAGGYLVDFRKAAGSLDLSPGSRASVDPVAALEAALLQLRSLQDRDG